MGLLEGTQPPIEAAELPDIPYLERLEITSRFWVEHGFGAPKITHIIYVVKLVVFFSLLGLYVIATTSDFSVFDFTDWWTEPIFYQKMIIWTVVLETLGMAGSWGPLAGHFKPFTAGVRTYARPGTIRQPPWTKVPLTQGMNRTVADVAIYVALVGAGIAALVLPAVDDADLTAMGFVGGRIGTPILVALAVLLVVMGLRDKTIFLAARGEQYLPAIVMFAAYAPIDMIVGLKLLIVSVWIGAGISKFGKHFGFVVPPMVANTPWVPGKSARQKMFKSFPEDLRPSHYGALLAHAGGTFVELAMPIVLLFSTNRTVTIAAVAVMVVFHLFIISTFPLAVPLEWNVVFAVAAMFLFLGYPAQDGFGLGDMDAGLALVTIVALAFFPVLGNLRPDLVSFLPSMRQYAGNWASATWAFASPEAESKLDLIPKASAMTVDQLAKDYGREQAEVVCYQVLGWRAMHSQGRGLNSIMLNTLGEDIDHYTMREAEFSTNCIIGFNFGDGHLHDHRFIAEIQRRCQFAPGEFIVAFVESQAIHASHQDYIVIDAAVGIVERGRYQVADAADEQPWLPNGPIPLAVEWRMPGYERVSHGPSAAARPTSNGARTRPARTAPLRADGPVRAS